MPKMRLQGCAPDPAGEAYNALPDPIAGFWSRFAARSGAEGKGKGEKGVGEKGGEVEESGEERGGSRKLCIPGSLRGGRGCAALGAFWAKPALAPP